MKLISVCVFLELSLLLFVCEIKRASPTVQDCLNCWSNLCTRPSGSADDCDGNSCTDITFGTLVNSNQTTVCCPAASSYVFDSITNSTNLMTPAIDSDQQTCSETVLNEFNFDPNNVEFIKVGDSKKQFFLKDTGRFDCAGCIKNVTIYTNVAVSQLSTSTLQLWATNTFNNKTLLTLKQEVEFNLYNEDSIDDLGPGNTNFRSTRSINGSFCFNSSDIFGIIMPLNLGMTVLTPKPQISDGLMAYAREVPSCKLLENTYIINSTDLLTTPIIALHITGPEIEPESSAAATSSMNTELTSTYTSSQLLLPMTPSTTVTIVTDTSEHQQSATHVSTDTRLPSSMARTASTGIESLSQTSSMAPSIPSSPVTATTPTVPLPLVIGVSAGSVVFIVVLLLVIGLVVGVCLLLRAKSYIKDVNGIEMMGHTGRNSIDDMLDFQTRTVSPGLGSNIIGSGSMGTPQYSTPVHGNHTYQHPRSSFQQSNYYDDPTVLDTSKIDLSKSRDYLDESPDYTTMNSDVNPRATPTSINGSRSTVSDNSFRKNQHLVQYDVPQSRRGGNDGPAKYNDYDEPTALGMQVGTLDPYAQSIEINQSQRVDNNNRQYFVLEQDSMPRMMSNPQLPIYHVLERGYHVPSAQERGTSRISYETEKLNQQPFFEEQPQYWEPAEQTESIYDQLSEKKCRELKRSDITLVEELGGGQFGTVWKGVWSLRGGGRKNVAVKICKENVREDEKARLLREGARMMQFFHTHVVQLFGIVTIDEPICLVIELMTEGDLKEYLKSCRPDIGRRPLPPNNQLLKFCRDVAAGMRHLAKKHFVHRDLAARNIMLNEKLVCKIGDFGMARSSNHSYNLNKPEQVPLRWTAPEALKSRQYSEKSDVYSYGMLMFEIWSLGRNPFPLLEDNQLIVNFISGGRIMPPPPGCPREMYRLMTHSWHPYPSERPSFEFCCDFLSSDNDSLLQWNSEDYDGLPPEVTQLGADVQYGHDLYTDLQHQYRTEEY